MKDTLETNLPEEAGKLEETKKKMEALELEHKLKNRLRRRKSMLPQTLKPTIQRRRTLLLPQVN